MKNLRKIFIPKPATLIALLFFPIGLTIYFLVTQYSNKFLAEQDVTYFDIQNGFVRMLLFDNKVSGFLLRFSDFALWGVFAAIVLVTVWFIGASRTTASNHTAVEGFVNFNQSTGAWHTGFAVKLVMKVLLVGICLYALVLILVKLAPGLVTNVSAVLTENTSVAWLHVILSNAYIYIAELAFVVAAKAFKRIELS